MINKLRLRFLFWLLSKYCYWHDVLFTLVDNSQLRLWYLAVEKKDRVGYNLRMSEKHKKGAAESWDELV